MNKFYITTPIYYASGNPHIGHAFATLYADVLARFARVEGKDVFFSAGMDEHGAKIAEAAKNGNQEPQEFVNEIAKKYVDTWKALGINYSDFIRTTSDKHAKAVTNFIERLQKAGDIYESEYEGLYCMQCESFKKGKDLTEDGLCPDHLKPPQKVKEKNYFFKLEKYLPEIQERIMKNELCIMPESRKNEILGMIKEGIPDFSVSRDVKKVRWGIPFPGDKSQTIYVWIDALINYLSILDFPDGKNFKKYWPADLHVIGAEINKFHSIFWPALLLSAGLPLPKNIFVHGLFTINGQKMSKTVGNVIDPLSIIEKFGVDATRYLLLSQFPASEHGDVKEEKFVEKYNGELANGIGNLFERVATMVASYGVNVAGQRGRSTWQVEETEAQFKQNMESYKLFEALQAVNNFAKSIDKYINEKQPWVMAKNEDPALQETLAELIFGVEKIIEWLTPFMPSKMSQAREHFEKINPVRSKKPWVFAEILKIFRTSNGIKTGALPPDQKLALFPRKQ